ncbi:MAG: hypothetical protein JXR97_10605, partial [Planctomycetes bacterium]|nr:hypothetical protein [Planctomycetota bacterium]
MTIKMVVKIFISVIGAFMIFALWRSGAIFIDKGVWYGLAILLMFGGAVPRQTGYCAFIFALAIAAHQVFWMGGDLMGMSWGHSAFCAGLAAFLVYLAGPSEVRLWKCPKCYWHGPSTDTRFGRCPRCGYS